MKISLLFSSSKRQKENWKETLSPSLYFVAYVASHAGERERERETKRGEETPGLCGAIVNFFASFY